MTVLVRIIIASTVVLFVGFGSVMAADSTEVADTVSYPEVQHDRSAIEYILALPSIVLQAPFHVVAGLVAIPVYVIENEELLPEIERILSTFELEGIRPVAGYSSTKGFIGGVALRKGDLFAEGVGFGLKGSYSTNMYRFSSVVLGGERWGNGPFGLIGEFGWQARTRERFHGIGPS
ncbi:MAG: hypothetical protein GF341_03350, partial [candidate division Zixibacteria bacterium]|nr:hypothetical protein [candidate division Zixibacteria bacterium]